MRLEELRAPPRGALHDPAGAQLGHPQFWHPQDEGGQGLGEGVLPQVRGGGDAAAEDEHVGVDGECEGRRPDGQVVGELVH